MYSAQPLDLNNLKQSIVDIVNNITALQFQNSRDVATLYYLFKLDLNKVNRTMFLVSKGWTCTSQCSSGNSIVLQIFSKHICQGCNDYVKYVQMQQLLSVYSLLAHLAQICTATRLNE